MSMHASTDSELIITSDVIDMKFIDSINRYIFQFDLIHHNVLVGHN